MIHFWSTDEIVEQYKIVGSMIMRRDAHIIAS